MYLRFHTFEIMISRNTAKAILSILLIVIINYALTLKNDFSLDDHYYYSQVEFVNTISDIPNALKQKFSIVDYRPVTTFTFAIEKIVCGEPNPAVGHFINLIIYILNCTLVYILVEKLQFNKKKKWLSIFVALLFASLPIHTSMVANIKSRDGLLSFFFGINYLLILIRIISTNENFVKKILLFFLGLISIILGIYSKLDAFNFLIITPFIFIIFYSFINVKIVLRIVLITILTLKLSFNLFNEWIESRTNAIEYSTNISHLPDSEIITDPITFTENPIASYPELSDKIAYAIQTIFEYVVMVFKPIGHYFYFGYDMIPILPMSNSMIWMKLIVLCSIFLSGVLLFRTNKLYFFSITLFFTSLIYCSNLVTPVSGIIADRYAFIASLGACISLSIIILKISEYLDNRFNPEKLTNKSFIITSAPFILIILIYLPFNIQRTQDWKDLFSIFEADLPKISTKSYEANRIAVKNYVETAIDSDDPNLRNNYFTKAIKYANNAVKIYPDGQLIQEGIIMSLYGLNDFKGAVDYSRKVIEKFDTTEVGWRMLTEYYYSQKQYDSAAIGYRKLIDLIPTDPNVYFFYVTTLQQNNQTNKAFDYLDSLINQQPNNYLPYQAKTYLYLNMKDSLNAFTQMEYAMERGWRDIQILDMAGVYWNTKDRKKWEYLKKYIP